MPTLPLRPIVLACAALAASVPVHAQEAALDQVTIVGSRAKARTVFDSAVPVDVFNAREVANALSSGEVGAALQHLAPSINFPRIESSGASDSVRGIQLRGLAPDQVLVLVNGKRRHASALLDTESNFAGSVPVDVNAIPAGAIERIEILRDGAGAQYGSDAVAGVINIVLKKGRSGGTASVGYGINHTDFEPVNRTLTDGQSTTVNADYGIPLGDTGFLRFGFDARRRAPTQRAGNSDAGWTSWNSTPADLALDGQVLFKSGDARQDSGSLFYNTQVALSGGIDVYSFATLNRRLSDGSAWFRYPGDPSNVVALYPAGYRPVTHGGKTDASIVAGVKFAPGAWNVDASVRHGSDSFNYGVSNSVNASLGDQSPASFHLASFRFQQQGLNIDATRELDLGWRAPVSLALGAELLHEAYRSLPGDPASYAGGAFTDAPPGAQAGPGLRPNDAFDGSRNVRSVYADAETEFGALLLGAAARWSDYSDFGGAATGKLSARYKFSPGLLVRGAVSNSFRAPALAQTGFRFSTLNFNADGTGLQTAALLPASDALARAFGAQPLKPEKSDNLSLGLAWRATGNTSATSLSLDAYRIRLRDRITRTSDLQSDAVSAYLGAQGRTDIQSVAYLANLLDTTTRGIDAVLNHEHKVAGGTLNLSAALNVNQTRLDQARTGSAALARIDPDLSLLSDTGLFRLKHASPKNKLVLGADWQGGAVGVQVRATRFGALHDFVYDSEAPVVDGVNAQYFGPVWSADLEAQYKVNQRLTASVGGNNIFDRYPDRVRQTNAATYGGALPYNFINPVGVNGAWFYAKLTYMF